MIRVFISSILVAGLIIGCSGESTPTPEPTPATIIGKWVEVNGDDIFTFNEDGTVVFVSPEEGEEHGKYKFVDSDSVRMTFPPSETQHWARTMNLDISWVGSRLGLTDLTGEYSEFDPAE
jgi:hypothetical protein